MEGGMEVGMEEDTAEEVQQLEARTHLQAVMQPLVMRAEAQQLEAHTHLQVVTPPLAMLEGLVTPEGVLLPAAMLQVVQR